MQVRRLTIVLAVVGVFFFAEFAGGVLAGSHVLRMDALHLLMDCVALAASLIAMRLASRKPTARFTFGLRRAEPVAALLNAVLVLMATIEIVHNAFESLATDAVPNARIMLPVSTVALFVNGFCAWLLHGAMGHGHEGHGHEGHGHDLNLRGVWLHLMGDALGSLMALAAAIVIWFKGPRQADLVASLVVATIIAIGALRLIRDALIVLLEAAPRHLPVDKVRAMLAAHPGVASVVSLHVWTLGSGHDVVMGHVLATDGNAAAGALAAATIKGAFGVEYVTIQVDNDSACGHTH
jgi:cobalt-zinc-cadmium efflux system protein